MTALLFTLALSLTGHAQDEDFSESLPATGEVDSTASGVDRDPAALVIQPRKRTYPGGADEEDLRVQAALPESEQKVDARTLQRDVFKALYNQDLKEERRDDAEE